MIVCLPYNTNVKPVPVQIKIVDGCCSYNKYEISKYEYS